MKGVRLGFLAVAMLSTSLLAHSAPPAPRDGGHDFDFLIGD